MIEEEKGIPSELQIICTGNMLLSDELALKEIFFYANCLLKLRIDNPGIFITISNVVSSNTTLLLNPNDNIGHVKKVMHRKEGVEPRIQVLVRAGQRLEDQKSLKEYGIGDESVLNWIVLENCVIPVIIKIDTGKFFVLDVELDLTIKQVKEKIEEKEGIPSDIRELVFAGYKLDNNKTLRDYSIGRNAVFYFYLNSSSGMQIVVNTNKGPIFYLMWSLISLSTSSGKLFVRE